MANFILGSAVKFEIDLSAEGFSMNNDDFDVEIAGAKNSVYASKNTPDPQGNFTIYKESNTWYGILKTDAVGLGDCKLIATAYITDSAAHGGNRKEIASTSFGRIVKP